MSSSDKLIEQVIFFLFFFFFSFVCFVLFFFFYIYFAAKIILQRGEKLSRVGKITGLYRSYPQLFKRFLTKRGEPFTWETKSWPGQNGDPRCFVTLSRWLVHPPSPANFSLYKPLCSSSRVNSVKKGAVLDNQSTGERCWVGQRSQLLFS